MEDREGHDPWPQKCRKCEQERKAQEAEAFITALISPSTEEIAQARRAERDQAAAEERSTCGRCVAGLAPCPTHPDAPEGEGP